MLNEITDFFDAFWHGLAFLLVTYLISSWFLSVETKIEAGTKRKFKLKFNILLLVVTIGFPVLLIVDLFCKLFFLTLFYGPVKVLKGNIWMNLNSHKLTITMTDGAEFGQIAHFTFRAVELFVGYAFGKFCYEKVKNILKIIAPVFYEQAAQLIKSDKL